MIANSSANISEFLNDALAPLVVAMNKVLFWDPVKALGIDAGAEVPLVVIWLIGAAIYFTIRMKFINFRGFKHAIHLIRGKYDHPDTKGEVSHFQALATALSATVGLGNIAGVAIAISIGGPGATFWMIIAGLLGMTLKFTECTLAVKYRKIDKDGQVAGGPMYYLDLGLQKKNMKIPGKILALLFGIMVVCASFGGGNMFQSNQAYQQLASIAPFFEGKGFYIGLVLAFLVGIVIIGGLKSIVKVTERIVPVMAIIYVGFALIIIGMNITKVGEVFYLIFDGAFNAPAMKGGFIGVLIQGLRRASFSNEAGVGSAAIAHSAAKTNEPVSEGIVALLEPFIDTVVVCTMTAMVLIFTGFYNNPEGLEGAPLTSAAFGSVISWFPYVLVLAIFLFAFSTMISWSYYGLKGFNYLFLPIIKRKKLSSTIYNLLFLSFVVIGAAASLDIVVEFMDMLLLGMAFPNVAGLIILMPEVSKDLKTYLRKVKSGEIKRYK